MTTPADPSLRDKWEMKIKRALNGMEHTFFMFISRQENGRLEGNILNDDGTNGTPLTGFYMLSSVTSPFSMGLTLDIDGTVIILSGVGTQADPREPAKFDGLYHKVGRQSFDTLVFDPGETGTGGGNQTT
jgi:hypothetical protein